MSWRRGCSSSAAPRLSLMGGLKDKIEPYLSAETRDSSCSSHGRRARRRFGASTRGGPPPPIPNGGNRCLTVSHRWPGTSRRSHKSSPSRCSAGRGPRTSSPSSSSSNHLIWLSPAQGVAPLTLPRSQSISSSAMWDYPSQRPLRASPVYTSDPTPERQARPCHLAIRQQRRPHCLRIARQRCRRPNSRSHE